MAAAPVAPTPDRGAERLTVEGLRYARAVVENGSFTAAARAAGVSQPALSNSVANLEEKLGGRLFDRSTRGVSATAFGAQVLPLIEAALTALDSITAEARRLTGSGNDGIRIGVSPLIDPQLVARAHRAVRRSPPLSTARELVLREANLEELRASLRSGELDMILVPSVGPLPRFEHRVIGYDPVVVLGASARPADDSGLSGPSGTGPPPIDVGETLESQLIMVPDTCGLTTFTHQLFEAHDRTPRAYPGEAASYRVLEDWANLGLGSAILPRSKVASPDTPYRPLIDDGLPVEIFYEAVWNPHAPMAHDLDALATAISAA
jgi:DNA-binding transcriptional LysR family regulator